MHRDHTTKRRKVVHNGTLPLSGTKSLKRFTPIRGGRPWTISIAIPGSMLNGLPTADQRVATVARIARSLAIFCVDEVVVYNDAAPAPPVFNSTIKRLDDAQPITTTATATATATYTGDSDPCHFLAQLLAFLECPPFMRRRLFPLHPNLRRTALLPRINMPHHRGPKDPWLPYVEGVTVAPDSPPPLTADDAASAVTLVDTGLDPEPVQMHDAPVSIPPNTRVTLHFASPDASRPVLIHPETPRTEGGYYWGYAVRASSSLSGVFTECPYSGGYDLSFGTSERGAPLPQVLQHCRQKQQQQQQRNNHGRNSHHFNHRGRSASGNAGYSNNSNSNSNSNHDYAFDHGGAGCDGQDPVPAFQHLVIVFGGPRGIELAAANDAYLVGMDVGGARTRELFDYWVNVLPNQGVGGISTEEAVPIALMGLRSLWEAV